MIDDVVVTLGIFYGENTNEQIHLPHGGRTGMLYGVL